MHAWTDKALRPINAQKSIPGVYNALIAISHDSK